MRGRKLFLTKRCSAVRQWIPIIQAAEKASTERREEKEKVQGIRPMGGLFIGREELKKSGATSAPRHQSTLQMGAMPLIRHMCHCHVIDLSCMALPHHP
ncbi:hypothetical protein MA16_Dca003237 [Dendrobium catenatum]|uniref:Uncharacterized protein n=1 Tax=Dendrobium catenatum TaxID=906689 RepID=A0A2I0XC41_9ASPA|nr:hypothetical protein MA16_Dca003237 [Dendrobium catenatum]